MTTAGNDMVTFGNVGIGFAVSTGILAATTVIILAVDRKKAKDEVPRSLWPLRREDAVVSDEANWVRLLDQG